MEQLTIDAALAGLLHNIGILAQRAAGGTTGDEIEWTLRFIAANVPTPHQAAARAGAYYADPSRNPTGDADLSERVALADLLSLGEAATGRARANPAQLVTIFDRVSLSRPPRAENFVPLAPLALRQEAIFPGKSAVTDAEARRRYAELGAALAAAVKRPAEGPIYVENVLEALRRLAWCVPTRGMADVADVSLFDHARTTAALAVCLAGLEAAQVKALLEAVRRDLAGQPAPGDDGLLGQPAALLVGGDISGVQDFIYTLSSKGAARTLRGRSFYLQLLTEAILRYVLRELGLPYTNVIYAGGGHFYLLAPPSAEARLPELRAYITRTLLAHHGAALYVALDCAAAPFSAFKPGRFPEVWGQMHAALARAKQRRYLELGETLHREVFEPQAHGGNRKATCAVCGEEGRPVEDLGESDDPEAKICALCRSFQVLGRDLTAARFVALGLHAPVPTQRGGAPDVLRAFGVSAHLTANAGAAPAFSPADPPEAAIVYALGDERRWPPLEAVPAVQAVRYTVHRVPRDDFSELEEKSEGIKRLGVLRMDVDQLGELFSRGFGVGQGSRATLARLAALSFQLSLFFEGWVKYRCEEKPDLIYAVYAGGDDVFLIGPWHEMPELATNIANDLSAFAGENPDVHVSGGMAFIHGKYPVYQAAEDAGDALKKAKALPGQNALSFLGQAWPWPVFDRVTKKQTRLAKLVQPAAENGLDGPQAVLQVLQQLAAGEAEAARRQGGRPVWGPWMWHGAYQLTRMAERAKNKPELGSKLKAIRDELSANDYREIDQWGAAARWAQLRLRKQDDQETRRQNAKQKH